MIRVNGLTFAYRDGPPVLRGLHIDVSAGESVGIVGPNGAGKTTLLLCLCGALPTPRGCIQVAGLDPADPRERRDLPARVGIVFQNCDDQIIHGTVEDDVAFGPLNLGWPDSKVRESVDEAIRQVGLHGLEGRSPHQLSGGEQRRVALAGVLAMQPDILLLDEPTMFLDPQSRRKLIEFLNQIVLTKIIAGHDLDLVLQTCRRTIVLASGEIHADGPTGEILGNAGLLEPLGLEVPYRLRSRHSLSLPVQMPSDPERCV